MQKLIAPLQKAEFLSNNAVPTQLYNLQDDSWQLKTPLKIIKMIFCFT